MASANLTLNVTATITITDQNGREVFSGDVEDFHFEPEYQSTSASFRAPVLTRISTADRRIGYRYILDGTGRRIRIERNGSQSATYAHPHIEDVECPRCRREVYGTVFRVLPHRCRR